MHQVSESLCISQLILYKECVFFKSSLPKIGTLSLNDIMHEVQIHLIFPDSKEFVDMPLRSDASDIRLHWNELDKMKFDRDIFLEFVNQHFDPAGSDMEIFHTFPDFKEKPEILNRIIDPSFQRWAYELNALWPIFGRKVNESVKGVINCFIFSKNQMN